MNNFTKNNGGLNINDEPIYLCDEIFDFATITGALFILVFILSVAGNVLLLCVIFIYESLKNVTNIFVLNLACSDLIFTATLPFWATYYLHHWVFGDFLCKFMIAAYFAGLYSSIILLTAMSVDRFITVVLQKWPKSCLTRLRCSVVVCVAAWVIGIAASLSDAINVKAKTQWNDLTSCEPSSDDDFRLGYFLQVSLLFILPFVIIVFCYSAILKTVLQSSNRKRHRTVVVVLCIVAVFFICWGPYNLMIFLEGFYEPKTCNAKESFINVYHICQILAYSHCCMNPLLYLLSEKLRKHLLHLLHCDKALQEKEVRGPTTVTQTVMSVAQNSAVILEMQPR